MKPRSTHTTATLGGFVLLSALALSLFPVDVQAQKGGKGNDGKVGGDVSGSIFCRVTFDDRPLTSDGIVGDGWGEFEAWESGEYVDAEDNTEMRVGRNRGIFMDFNTHMKKASIRHLHLPGGFPLLGDTDCPPTGTVTTQPVGAGTSFTTVAADGSIEIRDARLAISGEDHDDTLVGVVRQINALLTLEDDNGETWFVYFGQDASGSGEFRSPCGDWMVVERLSNILDPETGETHARWRFSTAGFGYVWRDNNPPHGPTEFWGTVSLPMSGTIESLSDEPQP